MVGPALPTERIHAKQRELDALYEKRLVHRANTGPHQGIDHTDLRLTMQIAMLQQQIEREHTMGRDYNALP